MSFYKFNNKKIMRKIKIWQLSFDLWFPILIEEEKSLSNL